MAVVWGKGEGGCMSSFQRAGERMMTKILHRGPDTELWELEIEAKLKDFGHFEQEAGQECD